MEGNFKNAPYFDLGARYRTPICQKHFGMPHHGVLLACKTTKLNSIWTRLLCHTTYRVPEGQNIQSNNVCYQVSGCSSALQAAFIRFYWLSVIPLSSVLPSVTFLYPALWWRLHTCFSIYTIAISPFDLHGLCNIALRRIDEPKVYTTCTTALRGVKFCYLDMMPEYGFVTQHGYVSHAVSQFPA